MTLLERVKTAWNIFRNRDPTIFTNTGYSEYRRPDRRRVTPGKERTMIASIINRIAMDVAAMTITHARLDEHGRFLEQVKSSLNTCLTLEANLDQSAREFKQDVVTSLLDDGCVAIVATDTNIDPLFGGPVSYEKLRTGKIEEWYPTRVKVNLYNERTGKRQSVIVDKKEAVIIENPFYSVMNEPNSTMQRLIRKLSLLDTVDEQSSSGKLDLIVQLPYAVKSDLRRQQAERRRADIEAQLNGSKYGIAYTDAAEKITQLNRPVENNLMKQVEYLTSMLFSQLGMTQGVLDGSADEKTMMNYYSRIVEPILAAICDGIRRKWLTKTARTQRQDIVFFREPLKLIPVSGMSDIADSMIRNQILSPNEVRQMLSLPPSKDPKADELRNPNIAPSEPTHPGYADGVLPKNDEGQQ